MRSLNELLDGAGSLTDACDDHVKNRKRWPSSSIPKRLSLFPVGVPASRIYFLQTNFSLVKRSYDIFCAPHKKCLDFDERLRRIVIVAMHNKVLSFVM